MGSLGFELSSLVFEFVFALDLIGSLVFVVELVFRVVVYELVFESV